MDWSSSHAPTLNVNGHPLGSSTETTTSSASLRPKKSSKKLTRPSTAPTQDVSPILPSSRFDGSFNSPEGVTGNLPSVFSTPSPMSTNSHTPELRSVPPAADYDWATFIAAYAAGKWDPNKTPQPPISYITPPPGYTSSNIDATVIYNALQGSQESQQASHPLQHERSPQSAKLAGVNQASSSFSQKSISRPAAPTTLNLPPFPAHRMRNSFSSGSSSTSSAVEATLSTSPLANAERQTAAAALRWAGARNAILSPLALPSPEHELTDPMRGVTAAIPGAHPVTSDSQSRWNRLSSFWQGTQDIGEPSRLSTIEGSPSTTPLNTPPLPVGQGGESSKNDVPQAPQPSQTNAPFLLPVFGGPQGSLPPATAPANKTITGTGDNPVDPLSVDYFGVVASHATSASPQSSSENSFVTTPDSAPGTVQAVPFRRSSESSLDDVTSGLGTLSVPAVPRRICLTRQSSAPLPTIMSTREEILPGGRTASDGIASVRAGRAAKEEQMYLDLGYLVPPNPPDELERRRAMYKFNIWNTGPDSNFDRIAHLAKLVFNTKGVVISLLDTNEQWYKSSSGTKALLVERAHTLSAHAILQRGDEPMVILDTHRDWRFEKHPMVTGSMKIRFYAGAPLRTQDGYNIGCLAVFDDLPRDDFNPRQRHTLKEFAAIAMREMELWRDKIQLRIRDRIQNSMEEFSRECLEVDHNSEEQPKEALDDLSNSMDTVYDRAATLVRTTLDVEGVLVMDVSQADLTENIAADSSPMSVVLHNGDIRSPSVTRIVSPEEYNRLIEFFAKNPEGRISEGIIPTCFRPFLPTHIQYALTVPIFNVDRRPFALLCAYNTPGYGKRYLEGHELSYLRAIGVIILSAVLKRRMILADKAKSLFISNISHELRTPLHGILAAAELLSDTPMNASQLSFLHTVQACGTSLVETVNHVLDFTKLSGNSKIGSYENSIAPTEVNLQELIEEAVDGCWVGYHARQAASHGNSGIGSVYAPPRDEFSESRRLHVEAVIDIQMRSQGWNVKCEKGGIRRVFMNIFGNALKFTSNGYVHVILRQLPDLPDQPPQTVRLELSVVDTGKGINQHFLKNQLFHPFSQENPLQTGTGLGLAIVNSIVQSLHGSIDVQSEEGSGTEVKVAFTAECLEPATVAIPEPEPFIWPNPSQPLGIAFEAFDMDHTGSKLLHSSLVSYLQSWWNFRIVSTDEADIIVLNDTVDLVERASAQHATHKPFLVLCTSRSDRHFLEVAMEHEKVGGFCRIVYKPVGPSALRSALNLCTHAIKIAMHTPSSGTPHPEPDPSEDSIGSPAAHLHRRNSEDQQGQQNTAMKRPSMPPRSITAPPAWLSLLSPQPQEQEEGVPEEDALDPDTALPAITIGKDGALLKSSVNTLAQDRQHSFRILVIEDNVVLRNLLLRWLKTKGYIYREAVDGRDGVSMYEHEGPFDVVLLDLSMPVLDGIEATAEIRKIEATRKGSKPSRILALTGMSSLEDKTRAFDAGVDGYLVKPVPFKMLEDIFRKLGLSS